MILVCILPYLPVVNASIKSVLEIVRYQFITVFGEMVLPMSMRGIKRIPPNGLNTNCGWPERGKVDGFDNGLLMAFNVDTYKIAIVPYGWIFF